MAAVLSHLNEVEKGTRAYLERLAQKDFGRRVDFTLASGGRSTFLSKSAYSNRLPSSYITLANSSHCYGRVTLSRLRCNGSGIISEKQVRRRSGAKVLSLSCWNGDGKRLLRNDARNW